MNERDLFDAITDVPDDLVEEARTAPVKQATRWVQWVALTACAAVVATLVWVLYPHDEELPVVPYTTATTATSVKTTTTTTQTAKKKSTTKKKSSQSTASTTTTKTTTSIVCVFPHIPNELVSHTHSLEPIVKVTDPKGIAFNDTAALEKIKADNPLRDDFQEAVNDFSYGVSHRLIQRTVGNKVYSPYSLYYTYASLQNGAVGATRSALGSMLGNSTMGGFFEQCRRLYQRSYCQNEVGQFRMANSFWINCDYPLRERFVEDNAQYFYSSTYSVDFTKEDTGNAMRQWLSNNSGDPLTSTLNPSKDSSMIVLGTANFSDQWETGFDPNNTVKDRFTMGEIDYELDFMTQTVKNATYTRGENYTRSSLKLKNGSEMIFVLPDEGLWPNNLVSESLSAKDILGDTDTAKGTVHWKIPKFKITTQDDLKDVLKSAYLYEKIVEEADYSRISDDPPRISNSIHEVSISIGEAGVNTKAAPPADLSGSESTPSKHDVYMTLNHPFIFAIRSPEGNLLYVGVYEDAREDGRKLR